MGGPLRLAWVGDQPLSEGRILLAQRLYPLLGQTELSLEREHLPLSLAELLHEHCFDGNIAGFCRASRMC